MVGHAQCSYYQELLDAGVKIYLYPAPWILHSKHFSVDDEVAVIGSSNMDMRSFSLNYEVVMMLVGGDFVARMRAAEDKLPLDEPAADRRRVARPPAIRTVRRQPDAPHRRPSVVVLRFAHMPCSARARSRLDGRCMMRRGPVGAGLRLPGVRAGAPRRSRGRAVVLAGHRRGHGQLCRGVSDLPRHPAAARAADGDARGAGDAAVPAGQRPRPCRRSRGRSGAGSRVRGRRTAGVVEPRHPHPDLDHHRSVPPAALQPGRGGDQRHARPRRRRDRRGGGCRAADRRDAGRGGRGHRRHPALPTQGPQWRCRARHRRAGRRGQRAAGPRCGRAQRDGRGTPRPLGRRCP